MRLHAAALLAGCMLAAFQASALDATVRVTVSVNVIPSSGTCSAGAEGSTLSVACGAPLVQGGPFISAPGQSTMRLQYLGAIDGGVVAAEAGDIFMSRAQITGWRTVSHDNGRYVELTLAW